MTQVLPQTESVLSFSLTARNIDVIYPNGISCTLPADKQQQMLRTIPGLQQVDMIRAGYGVEYDCIDAQELNGLFCVMSVICSHDVVI